ncbi:MAG: Holliday junction branch migration protein RuvA [Candidatus Puniceispirillaceae bacterium]
MIAQLRGTLLERADNTVILDVGGVGYAVTVSGKTQTQLGLADPAVTLLTEMIVREDSMTLFGFLEPAERDAFRLLTTVQGVGAKAALAILSVLSPAELSSAIVAGDKAMVTRADGVGPKLAQRVVNELSEKIGKLPTLAVGIGGVDVAGAGPAEGDYGVAADAMSALLNLGYGRAEAHTALLRARQKVADTGAGDDVSSLIAGALQEMGS